MHVLIRFIEYLFIIDLICVVIVILFFLIYFIN